MGSASRLCFLEAEAYREVLITNSWSNKSPGGMGNASHFYSSPRRQPFAASRHKDSLALSTLALGATTHASRFVALTAGALETVRYRGVITLAAFQQPTLEDINSWCRRYLRRRAKAPASGSASPDSGRNGRKRAGEQLRSCSSPKFSYCRQGAYIRGVQALGCPERPWEGPGRALGGPCYY